MGSVGEIVRRLDVAIDCVGGVDGRERSLVKVSRDQTQPRLS